MCGNESHVLVEQRTSLFRLCNDLTEKTRKNVSRHRLLYKTSCHWLLCDPWSSWAPVSVPYWEFLLSAILSVFALGNLAYASQQAIKGKVEGAGKGSSACCAFFTLALLAQLHIMHSVNTHPPRNEGESLHYCEAGWSLLSGCLGTTLAGICGYLYLSAAQLLADRERSQRRRRLMHNAIMSSCRQEIALAIRAKMTVL
ncbi:unnamed protein product, partial [Mesorhabditis belari]|uniref:Uncharacterized protein n=1 Tax=Mesorhabditis belari TaxID=2138241 RepID=A0AAF3E9R5_9BILA